MNLIPPKKPTQPMTVRDLMAQWREWVEAIQSDGSGTTVWEDEFVENIGEQLEHNRPLSDKQAEILERIYAQRTS